ncbi:MAG: TerD family protein [Oscillospiraceae bacterium]|nr:TerD family protein [Oscillospiraceae bacterium]
MDSKEIQRLLDTPDNFGRVELPKGEFEGKFIVRKSCKINGNGSIFWSNSGPMLVVDAEKVEIDNLKIELTNSSLPPEQYVSVFCRNNDTVFTNVEVNGAILGIKDEEQFWGIPRIVDLGIFEAEKEHTYIMEIYSPVEAEISCNFHDVSLSVNSLSQGYNTITISVGKIRSGSLIYGNIVIKSAVERRIILCGTAGNENTFVDGEMLYTVDREAPVQYSEMLKNLDYVQLATMPEPEPETVEPEVEEINEEPADECDEENVIIVPGKRLPIAPKQYKIELTGKSEPKMDIDAYLFMLDSVGKVRNDKRMIFFGNDHSDCGSATYLNAPDKRVMYIDFRRIPSDVSMMVLLFSIYGNNPSHLFDKLLDGDVSILCENGVHMHLPLADNISKRTLLAVAFERTEGIWEMIPSGKGIGLSLEEICRGYGVTIV